MPATFVVVPQWQGSVATRAMRLADGAEAISGDLPASATRLIDVPVGAGESLETGVLRYSSLVRVRERMLEAIATIPGQIITIGGDCAISLAPVEKAISEADGDVVVLWFDAHPDLNSPDTSPSGGFNGMVLRALTGEGPEGLVPPGRGRVDPAKLVLCGTRDIDPGEARFIEEHGIPTLDVDLLQTPDALLEAVRKTGASRAYIHIDLDVLDPSAMTGLDYPLPFGLDVDALTTLIGALRERVSIAGATIAGFAPANPAAAGDDLPAILRIIGALTKA